MFERYYRELLGFLSRKVTDRATAADLTQEAYARLYATASRDEATAEAGNPRALLYKVARNVVADHYRKVRVRQQVEDAGDGHQEMFELDLHLGPESLQPDAILSGRERLAAIERAIAALPPRPREAFVLYKIDGLSRAQVAQKMGIGVKTVETHLRYAVEACLDHLRALDSGPPSGPAAGSGKDRARQP